MIQQISKPANGGVLVYTGDSRESPGVSLSAEVVDDLTLSNRRGI
jgi:hypothetical protein